ncbi:hypothetical protein TI04_09160 [Achromatium sp. WMS2]|nr:hypothetical protein TI04_09160 [Achromatium sp. WMS2]
MSSKKNNFLQDAEKMSEFVRLAGLNQTQLSDQMNEKLEQFGMEPVVSQRLASRTLCGERELDLPFGLAAANVLNTYLVNFIKKDILGLGNLETRLLHFDNEGDLNEYMDDLQAKGRIVVLSTFPSIGLITRTEKLFESPNVDTWEYYPFDSILNFAFSPFSPYSRQERVDICNKVAKLAEKKGNGFHFFLWPYNKFNMADFELSKNKRVICIALSIPGFEGFLEISSPLIYDKLEAAFVHETTKSECSTNDESRDFLYRLQAVIKKNHSSISDSVAELYDSCSKTSKLREMLDKVVHTK